MAVIDVVRIIPEMPLSEIRSFVSEVVIPYEKEDPHSQIFSMSIARGLYDRGILQLITPKVYGGKEAPVSDLIGVARELGYGSASVAATFIGNMLGYSAVVLYGRDGLKEKICRQYSSQFGLWSFGMTEGGVGSDLLSTRTVARRVPGGFILNGEKNFITNATYSSHLAIFARLVDENGKEEGISCFYVPGDSQGLERGPAMDKIGWKKANTGTLCFKDLYLPEEYLLGAPGQGLRILTHCLNRSKTLLGAVGVGIARRALDLASERLQQTERFDKALLEQPAIRHLLARLHTKVEAAWLLTCQAAAVWDAGHAAVKDASMAKLFGGSVAVEVSSQVMELFGARGYFNDYEVSRLISDAKAIEIVEGPSLVQELLIAKEVLPRPEKVGKSNEVDPFQLQKSELKKAS